MSKVNQKSVNISAPNLLTICVNYMEQGEIQGEFYHYYSEEPVAFSSVLELMRGMERLFDELVFPQASTKTRSFLGKGPEFLSGSGKKEKSVKWEELLSHKGKRGTFVTCVKFRQSSTWQGDFYWVERERKIFFSSALEFFRLLCQASSGDKGEV